MEERRICPWQRGDLLAASIRGALHSPKKILRPYVTEGMTAIDVGCGMGYFSLPMAAYVGESGTVIATDLQPEMLDGLNRRTAQSGITNVAAHHCKKDTLDLGAWAEKIDFALVFWMLHEVPDSRRLIGELHAALSGSGKLLFVEPKGHVNALQFDKCLDMMMTIGFKVIGSPKVAFSRASLLTKTIKK